MSNADGTDGAAAFDLTTGDGGARLNRRHVRASGAEARQGDSSASEHEQRGRDPEAIRAKGATFDETDQARAQEKLADFGSVVDTDQIQKMIDVRSDIAGALDLMGLDPLLGSQMKSQISQTAGALRDQASDLTSKLHKALAYINDGSIYSNSKGYAGRLAAAAVALEAVGFDSATGTFDLGGIDLSWVTEADDTAYWKNHDRAILEKYFTFDQNGNVNGVKDPTELARLLDFGFDYLVSGGKLSEYGTELTPDEKYLLTWVVANLAPSVYAGEEGAAGALTSEAPALPQDVVDWIADHMRGNTDNPLSTYLSFTFENGQMHSVYSPDSIQYRSGFSDFIELAGPLLGMDLDTQIVTFTYNGKEYRLQTWDGTYGMGTQFGGEIELYSRPAPGPHDQQYHTMKPDEVRQNLDHLTSEQVNNLWTTYDSVPPEEQPEIDLHVHSGGREELHSKVHSYWNYTDGPLSVDAVRHQGDGCKKEDTSVSGTLSFDQDPGLGEAARAALESRGYKVKDEGNGSFSIDWGQPDDHR